MHSAGTIVWQNGSLVAVDKAAGVLSVPGRQGASDPRPVLGLWLQQQLGQRVWPVHRLDFEVSGLVVFALTAEAHRKACQIFEQRRVAKSYEALTGFTSQPATGANFEWRSLLVRGKRRSFEAPHGDLAVTQARYEGSVAAAHAGAFAAFAPLCMWRLLPQTGRSHQLRVHLANNGYPIAGDGLYGGPSNGEAQTEIALRSVSLAFSEAADRNALNLPAMLQVASLWQAAATP